MFIASSDGGISMGEEYRRSGGRGVVDIAE